MGVSAAEKNRRKRERKKREREERRRLEEAEAAKASVVKKKEDVSDDEIEVEYVSAPLLLPSEPSSTRAISSSSSSSTVPDGLPLPESSGLPKDTKSAEQASGGDGGGEGNDESNDMESILRRFHSRSAVVVVSDDDEVAAVDVHLSEEKVNEDNEKANDDDDDEEEDDTPKISKRKLREMSRPSIAELKRRVARADLVEAHDVTAADPDFLICLKSVPGTVPVPRHWGRKRKYLQGKRGIEKPPFALPDFIQKTGITQIRSAVAEDESKQSAKQKNRSRVAPKLGGMDVDYRTLYDAFFKYQTKPRNMTKFGDLYFEGKEFETRKSADVRPGILSDRLKEALGMSIEGSTTVMPPPWLINMQRYGPPPSYPNLKIPGLNAPLPPGCTYGYHATGWGKPPVDPFGRPLYGGDPFGTTTATATTPGGTTADDDGFDGLLDGGVPGAGGLVTSDGKALARRPWGALPSADDPAEDDGDQEGSEEEEEEDGSEEESSGEEMAESDEDEEEEAKEGKEEEEEEATEDIAPTLSAAAANPTTDTTIPTSTLDLRKAAQGGDETPADPKQKPQLYRVLEQRTVDGDAKSGAVFASDVAYVVPTSTTAAPPPPEGAESVLSKAPLVDGQGLKKKRSASSALGDDDDVDGDLGKKFKF